ncbi:hypothetical protein So717_18120 [Roseobacter cerasinus]|uniref:Uncharacterized protein n=1 Tax=Roseobacter cerasinus TaxID=2602289 RepID=A0A640VPW6_9RHOB|nr:hypothetical protein [Roseobacter cerasinus]GFE50059.1 hypothetical protein So717_18120 [Roseobacter cerasinus]
MTQAEAILMGLRIWGSIGAVVAAIFLTIGMDRIDEDAREAYIFRPLLIPGVLVIWPLVLWRWYLFESGRERWPGRYDPPRRAHFVVGWLLPIGICAIIVIGLSQRQTWPTDIAPLQLSGQVEAAQ